MGHSYGGLIAQYIGQYSSSFSKIILYSPLLGTDISLKFMILEFIYSFNNTKTPFNVNLKQLSFNNFNKAITYA